MQTGTQDELLPDRDRLDDRQLAELNTLRSALRDLTALADAAELTRAELNRVLNAMSIDEDEQGSASPEIAGKASSSTLWDLASQASSAERYLLRTLPVNT